MAGRPPKKARTSPKDSQQQRNPSLHGGDASAQQQMQHHDVISKEDVRLARLRKFEDQK